MTITGSTRVFFIVGDPVAQVRAPEVYNHLFDRHGVDAVLLPIQVAPAMRCRSLSRESTPARRSSTSS